MKLQITEKKSFNLGYYRGNPENDTYDIHTPSKLYYYNKVSGNKIVPWRTLDECIEALLELDEINTLEDIIKKRVTVCRVTKDNYVVEEYSPEEVYDLANEFIRNNINDPMVADYFDESAKTGMVRKKKFGETLEFIFDDDEGDYDNAHYYNVRVRLSECDVPGYTRDEIYNGLAYNEKDAERRALKAAKRDFLNQRDNLASRFKKTDIVWHNVDVIRVSRDASLEGGIIDMHGSLKGTYFIDDDRRTNKYSESVKPKKVNVRKLKEKDVEIEVKHEGILEVPDGKNVDDLPLSHFEKLAKKKGLGKITKALNNLQVWNKNDDPKLSKWAGDMIDKLNKKLKKDESIKEYYIGSEYGEYFDEYSLRQRYNTMMMLDKLDDIINLYHDLGGDFDEFAIEATERGFSKIDIFTVGLCVEGIPVKEIEKRLRMLHLMDESISRKRFNEGWHNGDATISFTHNDDLEADLEEFLFDLFSDNPDVFEFDWYGKNTILYLACSEDDYKYIKWFIEDWKYKHRDEYDEAVSRKRSTKSSGTKANSVGRFLDNMIERGKIDEKQVTVVFDKNNNIMWLGKAGFYPLFMSNIEYRSSGYDADHPHEFWINARSYTTPFEESFKRNRVTEDLEWEIIHDSDDESGNPTLWSARIDSDRYGKFIWIEKSDIGYDVVCRSGSDNWYVLDSFKSLGRAKRYVDDLLDDIDELEEAKSVEDYSHLKESGRYDYFDVPDGSFDIYDDIPDETVDTKSKDYFNFVVNDVMTRCKDEREARRYMRAKGLPKSFIDDVIKEIDRIYD